MAAAQTAIQRAFPTRNLFRGQALRSLLWSAAAGILLIAFLFTVLLVVDLLATGGRLERLPSSDESRGRADGIARLLGVGLNPEAANETQAREELASTLRGGQLDNLGLIPTVWRTREHWGSGIISAVVSAIPWLWENPSALWSLLLTAVVLVMLRGTALARARRCAEKEGFDLAVKMRRHLHRQTLRLGPSDLSGAGGLQALEMFTRDVDRLRQGVTVWILRLGRRPLEAGLLVLTALLVDWRLAAQCLIPLSVCWYLMRRERERFEQGRKLDQDKASEELKILAEGLQKTRLVRGYGMEEYEHEQFQNHLQRYSTEMLAIDRRRRWSRWSIRVLATMSLALIAFLIGVKVLHPDDSERMALSMASLLACTFVLVKTPLEELLRINVDQAEPSQAADRLFRYLDKIPEVGQAVGAKFLQPVSRSLVFESVQYSTPRGAKLLNGLDLKLAASESIAVVALEPLAARALAYLLPRFIEPQAGRILFDGEDIAWVTLESLRQETAFVGGDDPSFTGSVLENIRCGDGKYTLQQVTEAAKLSHAHNFIAKLPQGYETPLGEHGERLAPDEGFRLGLARAVLRNPALLIVEEPEGISGEAKSLLDDAYNRITPERTVIFLPSRLSTCRRADRIVLLHEGRAAAVGDHRSLVKANELYRHWEYVRFNEFSRDGKA